MTSGYSSEVEVSPAQLAAVGVARPESDRVGSVGVDEQTTDLEGPARTAGLLAATGRDVAVVQDPPVPRLAVAVAVDLALDLDAPVLGAGLQLPFRGARASAAADDVVLVGDCGGVGGHQSEDRDDGVGCEVCLVHVLFPPVGSHRQRSTGAGAACHCPLVLRPADRGPQTFRCISSMCSTGRKPSVSLIAIIGPFSAAFQEWITRTSGKRRW